MLSRYEPAEFEAKWQERWKEIDLFKTREDLDRPKFYGLDFFPYPSGAGLSVGHCRNYIPTDVLCRMKYMQGFNVLHPMGFDAFGLPAENEAIKRKRHPAEMIEEYGENYRRQMDLIGIGYDWSRSFYSSEPSYYKWTQWIFTKLYERGLAYQKFAAVNWDPVDKTVLADEEVIGGRAERSGALVEKKLIPQWFFKITDYAQQLLDDLDTIDWPEGIKNQQRNWIGRSEGVQFKMSVVSAPASASDDLVVKSKPLEFEVFTTRIDTIFGMTFCVLAPEHPLMDKILAGVSPADAAAVRAYVEQSKGLSEINRMSADREKTGVFTGAYAVNPANGQNVPIYVADYVLMGYGTGAIMAVPAHDERDFEFAEKFGIPIVPVISPALDIVAEDIELPFAAKDGFLVNSGEYTGQSVSIAQNSLGEWVEACEIGARKVNFRLRDWLISRQRYWGCPIPIVYDKDGNQEAVAEDALPVYLPNVEYYEPGQDGSSPLAGIPEFLNVTTSDGTLGRRETDTMGGFACSSWYFLRFCDPHNENAAFDPEKVKYWMPVDCYVGGAEHAVMHLLYARFWTKVLYDLGLVSVREPFARLQNQGQVLANTPYRKPREGESLDVSEDGILCSFEEAATLPQEDLTWKWARMSKSKGNVVTPDEAVSLYGADALRLYELFVTTFEADIQWSNDGMQGMVRFLSRIFKIVSQIQEGFVTDWWYQMDSLDASAITKNGKDVRRWTHQTLKKVEADINGFSFNTAVSALMIYSNNLGDVLKDNGWKEDRALTLALSEAAEYLTIMLSPMAPHSSDELWEGLGREGFCYNAEWPAFNADLCAEDSITIAVQVNGKLRDTIEVSAQASREEMEELAKSTEKIKGYLEGVTIRKVIIVPGKLVNIVVG
jgi:leucyl-tRNA synthetase